MIASPWCRFILDANASTANTLTIGQVKHFNQMMEVDESEAVINKITVHMFKLGPRDISVGKKGCRPIQTKVKSVLQPVRYHTRCYVVPE